MMRREADRYGVGIHHSELVGLIPQEALVDAAVWYTQLDQFEPEQMLETAPGRRACRRPSPLKAVRRVFWTSWPPARLRRAAVRLRPTAGRPAAALVAMVARLTVGQEEICRCGSAMQAHARTGRSAARRS